MNADGAGNSHCVSCKVFQALLTASVRADRHVEYEVMSDDSDSFWHISSFSSSLLEQYTGFKSVTAVRRDNYSLEWHLLCGLFYDAVSNSVEA
jgi:hypothetical protein